MLVLALVPTLSRALAAQHGSLPWAEVCTTKGVLPGAAVDGAEDLTHGSGHLEHCALCGLSAGSAPLPAAQPRLPLATGQAEVPRLFLQAARTLPAWRLAQPRAPPARA